MKNILSYLIFLITIPVFSQTPTLFYEDGGDLGPIQIRNEYVYYIDYNEGLKQLDLSNPTEDQLLVSTDEIDGDIKYFFWNADESYVYFGNIATRWYKAPFDITEMSDATLFMDFNSQQVYDLKEYNEQYFFPFTDIGTFLFKVTDIDPFEGGAEIGFTGPIVTNVAVEDDILYYSHGNTLHRATITSFDETMELLIDFEEFIDQLEVYENRVYALLKATNSIIIFNADQSLPWEPESTITLDTQEYTIENIAIHENDLYFTDSNQGSVFIFTEEVLSATETPIISNFLISHNLVEDILTLQIQETEIKELYILDINGRVIASYNEGKVSTYLNISFLSKGMYIAHFVMMDDTDVFTRFIKK